MAFPFCTPDKIVRPRLLVESCQQRPDWCVFLFPGFYCRLMIVIKQQPASLVRQCGKCNDGKHCLVCHCAPVIVCVHMHVFALFFSDIIFIFSYHPLHLLICPSLMTMQLDVNHSRNKLSANHKRKTKTCLESLSCSMGMTVNPTEKIENIL